MFCKIIIERLQTYHIHINGIVQGVGFRPMVYQLTMQMQLKGYVKNGSDGVHIIFNATAANASLFFRRVNKEAPPKSKIISLVMQETTAMLFEDFTILVEENDDCKRQVLIAADVATCSSCKNELHDKNNRRYRYPFITCTQCGPRYSIVQNIPFERHLTAMQQFLMCTSCKEEYNDVTDKRFFSQTNSCGDCGISMSIMENTSSILSSDTETVLTHIKNFLKHNKIIAVKGIGGYLLLCKAANAETIALLRKRKQRLTKPFAVLYPHIKMIEADFELSNFEKELLQSNEAPVVLLYPTQEALNSLAVNNIAPGLKRVGVMLPCNPLLELIINDFGEPLIATSANVSGSPIIYKDEDATAFLFDIADYVVSYNRDIIIPEDDSVVQVSKYTQQQIVLRRSRGYAPSFLHYQTQAEVCILSTGAFLKSSFTLAVNKNVFVSQFLGSGAGYESQQMYKNTLNHWLKLYNVKPEIIIADLHRDYFTHQLAVELTEKFGASLFLVQHHQAHFAGVLAENNLLHAEEPVLGVIWDGTGLGTDGNLWGGEFFKYENNEMLRCYHFDYFPAIAGENLALQPRIAALCTSSDAWPVSNLLKEKFTNTEWNNYQSLIESTNLFSSSAGRIFDAVASLLDICDKQTYEGEAAMYLQTLAEEYVDENGFAMDEAYFKEGAHYNRIPTATLMQGIISDIEKGKAKKYISAKFHYSLVGIIATVAKNVGVNKICFSGGVFQNALLCDWIQLAYGKTYQLYFHKKLSPNDENISFGQLVYYDNNITSVNKNSYQQQEIINLTSQIIN